MKIGSNEVVVLSKDKVKVGCQEVSRDEVNQVLKMMDNPPQKFKIQDSKEPGSVYLRMTANGNVVLHLRDQHGGEFHLITLTPEGFQRSTWCKGCGVPTENVGGREECVKIIGFN